MRKYHDNQNAAIFQMFTGGFGGLEPSCYFDVSTGLLGPETEVIGRGKMAVFSSYSYLSLNGHPKIVEAAKAAIEQFGTGAAGVRGVSGTNLLHVALEEKVAAWFNQESALAFGSGFAANEAGISAVFDRDDIIFADYYSHQSLKAGFAASGATVKRFRHNDMGHLRELLESCSRSEGVQPRNKVIVVEGVYSMHGSVVKLPQVLELAREFGCLVYVDEAHSLGVLGETGKGITEHFGIDPAEIDFLMGTFSKTIPSIGGYVSTNRRLRDQLCASPHMVYSAALSPPDTAAALAALEVIEAEPKRVSQLHDNIAYATAGMRELGINIGAAEGSAVLPIMFRGGQESAKIFFEYCVDRGVWLVPFFYPVVPKGQALARCAIMSGHTRTHIDHLLNVLEDGKRKFPFLAEEGVEVPA